MILILCQLAIQQCQVKCSRQISVFNSWFLRVEMQTPVTNLFDFKMKIEEEIFMCDLPLIPYFIHDQTLFFLGPWIIKSATCIRIRYYSKMAGWKHIYILELVTGWMHNKSKDRKTKEKECPWIWSFWFFLFYVVNASWSWTIRFDWYPIREVTISNHIDSLLMGRSMKLLTQYKLSSLN